MMMQSTSRVEQHVVEGGDDKSTTRESLSEIIRDELRRARELKRLDCRLWLWFGYCHVVCGLISTASQAAGLLSPHWKHRSMEVMTEQGTSIALMLPGVVGCLALSCIALGYITLTQLTSREKLFFIAILLNAALTLFRVREFVLSLSYPMLVVYTASRTLMVFGGVMALHSAMKSRSGEHEGYRPE